MRTATHRLMTAPKRLPPTFAGLRRSLPPGGWVAWAAGAWSLAYGGLGLFWALGGAGFPFGPNDAGADDGLSLFRGLEAGIGGPAIAGFGLLGALVGLAMASPAAHRLPPSGLTAFAWSLCTLLVLVVPDVRALQNLAYAVMLRFHRLDWPVVNQYLCLGGGFLWGAAAVVSGRRATGSCFLCGRSDGGGWTTPAAAARWGRWATWIAALAPLPYGIVRLAWFSGIPLGVSEEFVVELNQDIAAKGAEHVKYLFGSESIVGGILTLGLVQRWGEVFPRWVPVLAGRRVPIRLAVVPAALVAILATVAGRVVVGSIVLEGDFDVANWGLVGPALLWPVWGIALGAATLAYYLRRRGPCAACGATYGCGGPTSRRSPSQVSDQPGTPTGAEQPRPPRSGWIDHHEAGMHVAASTLVSAPTEVVSDVYAEYANWPRLFPTITGVRLIRREGTRLVLEIDHVEGKVINELVVRSPGEVELWEGKRHYDARFLNRFQAVPGGTRFTVHGDIYLKGLPKLFRPFLRGYVRRQMVRLQLRPVKAKAELRARHAAEGARQRRTMPEIGPANATPASHGRHDTGGDTTVSTPPLVLAALLGIVAGSTALIGTAAATSRTPVFLLAGLATFCGVYLCGLLVATRGIAPARRLRLRALLFGAGTVAVVAAFAATALRPMDDPRLPPTPVEGQHFWQLPTDSRIAYVRVPATGPARPTPVIFLHGGPGVPDMAGDSTYFGSLARDGFDVYVYDQVGSGRSSRLVDPRGYTLERDVADLEAIRTEIGAERVVLIGHSHGGMIAAAYAAAYSQHVAAMVLSSPEDPSPSAAVVSPTGRLSTTEQLRVYSLLLPPRPLLAFALLRVNPNAARAFAGDAELDARQDRVYNRTRPALHCRGKPPGPELHGLGFFANQVPHTASSPPHADFLPDLAGQTIPTLVIKGRCDYLSWSSAVSYLQALPDARLIYLHGSGHNAYQDEPARYLDAVRALLLGRPLPEPPYQGWEMPDDYEGPR